MIIAMMCTVLNGRKREKNFNIFEAGFRHVFHYYNKVIFFCTSRGTRRLKNGQRD